MKAAVVVNNDEAARHNAIVEILQPTQNRRVEINVNVNQAILAVWWKLPSGFRKVPLNENRVFLSDAVTYCLQIYRREIGLAYCIDADEISGIKPLEGVKQPYLAADPPR